jgi:hypothetical protein
MTADTDQVRPSSELLAHYLPQLTPQARSRLPAELERLHLLGDDIPHHEELIGTLRAELRKTGESHHRVGNPSRYFFEPLEPVLFDVAPERAGAGQIARIFLNRPACAPIAPLELMSVACLRNGATWCWASSHRDGIRASTDACPQAQPSSAFRIIRARSALR